MCRLRNAPRTTIQHSAAVLIGSVQKRGTSLILFQLELLKLRRRHLKGRIDLFEARLQGLFRRFGDLLQKIAAVKIVAAVRRALRLLVQLGNHMQIAYLGRRLGDNSEILVRTHLLKKGLRQPAWIGCIFLVWPFQNQLPVLLATSLASTARR